MSLLSTAVSLKYFVRRPFSLLTVDSQTPLKQDQRELLWEQPWLMVVRWSKLSTHKQTAVKWGQGHFKVACVLFPCLPGRPPPPNCHPITSPSTVAEILPLGCLRTSHSVCPHLNVPLLWPVCPALASLPTTASTSGHLMRDFIAPTAQKSVGLCVPSVCGQKAGPEFPF